MRRFPRVQIALVILLLAMALVPSVALPSASLGSQRFAGTDGSDHESGVRIQNFAFVPGTVVVPVDGSVRWTNNDGVDHTVTSTSAGETFDSGPLHPEDDYDHTFDTPGSYSYMCTIHQDMRGTVIVATDFSELFLPLIIHPANPPQ